jgi:hypothetical protein
MVRITGLRTLDIRFPTSATLDGSDAMNPDPDYSAAYVVLQTNCEGLEGHGLTFTIGRGNEIVCAIDFRYITDCITPEEALDFLTDAARGKAERLGHLLTHGYSR